MLVTVGTNHKFSPIELREKVSFSKKRLKDAISFLKEKETLKGAVILSTCNRAEVYASAENNNAAIDAILDFISRYHEVDREKILYYFYRYEDKEALRHLIITSCGLDSMVLGETQILGQVKFASLEAENANFLDTFLKTAFMQAIGFATKVHAETSISKGKTSIGSVAVDFIKKKTGSLLDKTILIVGTGKVTELLLKYLKDEAPKVVVIANRTYERAKALAGQVGAKAVRFDELTRFLKNADIVISATSSPHFVIRKETIMETMHHRLLILDLAIPRDVEPEVKQINGVELFNLEDLGIVIRENLDRKKDEVKRIRKIIDVEVEGIWEKLTELELEKAPLP